MVRVDERVGAKNRPRIFEVGQATGGPKGGGCEGGEGRGGHREGKANLMEGRELFINGRRSIILADDGSNQGGGGRSARRGALPGGTLASAGGGSRLGSRWASARRGTLPVAGGHRRAGGARGGRGGGSRGVLGARAGVGPFGQGTAIAYSQAREGAGGALDPSACGCGCVREAIRRCAFVRVHARAWMAARVVPLVEAFQVGMLGGPPPGRLAVGSKGLPVARIAGGSGLDLREEGGDDTASLVSASQSGPGQVIGGPPAESEGDNGAPSGALQGLTKDKDGVISRAQAIPPEGEKGGGDTLSPNDYGFKGAHGHPNGGRHPEEKGEIVGWDGGGPFLGPGGRNGR